MPISGTPIPQPTQADLSDRAWAIFFCLKPADSYSRQGITPTDIISDTAHHDTPMRWCQNAPPQKLAIEYHARTVPVLSRK